MQWRCPSRTAFETYLGSSLARKIVPRRASMLGGLLVLEALLVGPAANAFCRTTICDLDVVPGVTPPVDCRQNTRVDLCSTRGKPLFWPNGCLWFGVDAGGSVKLGISADELHRAVTQAFDLWAAVDCGGSRHPSFAMADTNELYGATVCPAPEFNKKAANANVWMFRDSEWPHKDPNSTIAVTSSSANVVTGELYDADVELNSFGTNIAVVPDGAEATLLTVVTHEAGHYLGLAHSSDPEAIMYTSYSPFRAALNEDDKNGICAIYPPSGDPTCPEPESKFGFSRYCGGVNPSTTPETVIHPAEASAGCGVARGRTQPSWALLVVAGVLFARRKQGPKRSAAASHPSADTAGLLARGRQIRRS
jgi:hypothetical protein